MDGVDDLVVEGYVPCQCGRWIVETAPGAEPGLCPECRGRLGTAAHAEQFRYEVEGRVIVAKPRRRAQAKSKAKRKLTDEQKKQRRRRDRAKIRAYVRLARIYRPMYDLLYAEELLREDCQPDYRRGRPRPKAIAAELMRDIEDAAEREAALGERLAAGG